MFMSGNYPLTVRVFNVFDPKSKVELNVKRYHHSCYYLQKQSHEDIPNSKVFVVENVPREGEEETYTIMGGSSLAFPMYFGDESLVLSIDGTPQREYRIRAGAKAKCYTEVLGDPDELSPLGMGTEKNSNNEEIDFYRGGSWEIDPLDDPKTGWKLTIKKYGPDPEDDDVIVGEDPPD